MREKQIRVAALQTDLQELPHPHRQVEGGNVAGQTSWSRALVRHGADPRTALAEVLGMGAEDIRVRDSPE